MADPKKPATKPTPSADTAKKPASAPGNVPPAQTVATAISDGGLRAATVASRIEHDGEIYDVGDVIPLTRAGFDGLAVTGALVETAWDDCAEE